MYPSIQATTRAPWKTVGITTGQVNVYALQATEDSSELWFKSFCI